LACPEISGFQPFRSCGKPLFLDFNLSAVAGSHYFLISTFPQLREAIISWFQPFRSCGKLLFLDFNLSAVAGSHYFLVSTFPQLREAIIF
jgi:surfactin synthase thioesterase subunit